MNEKLAPYTINNKYEFDKFVTQNWNMLNEYIDSKMLQVTVPFYSSIDIRESKSKYAPIDNNMYPAGFNNLCSLDQEESIPNFKESILKLGNNIQNVCILTESHTKNTFYLDNLFYLRKIIIEAGFNVRLISPDQNLFRENEHFISLLSHSKFEIIIEKCIVKDDLIILSQNQSTPIDLLLINNDQSIPLDIDWQKIKTIMAPTPFAGWFNRHKIKHFEYYKNVASAFCHEFSISPDLIQAKFRSLNNIDFSNKDGLQTLAQKVNSLKDEISPEQKIFIKASKGTYGMGINVVSSGDDILNMNRKTRNKLNIGKNNIKFTDIIIQEGIQTVIQYDNMPAEITLYLVGGKSIGGFMRVNSQKSPDDNLNSRGMVFKKFCISEIRQNQDHKAKEAVYTIIARLSVLASGHEINDILSKKEK